MGRMTGINDVYLIDAARTPFGRHRGGLSHIRTDDLAALPIRELTARYKALELKSVDDVYLGNANGAGEDNRNVARMALLLAGLPVTIPGITVNRLCASGAEAMIQASRAVAVGDARLVIAGGVESMSRAPYVLPKPDERLPRSMEMFQTTIGWRMVNPKFPSSWTSSLGACAERVAAELHIGRDDQDAWAARSHQRAATAWEAGAHDGFAFDVEGVNRDESIRPDSTVDTLRGLAPAFSPDGTVTAGNASPINDGAIAAFIGTREVGDQLEVQPLGRVVASATAALEPDRFSIAPVPAVQTVLDRAGKQISDADLWEINEAFAAMVLSVLHELPKIDADRVNVNGGAIAIGHPLGASAPRVVVDLCRELRRRGGGIGVAAACIGVGQGQAVMVEVG
jgi:acetyl-CoA acetyltransferase family protein